MRTHSKRILKSLAFALVTLMATSVLVAAGLNDDGQSANVPSTASLTR